MSTACHADTGLPTIVIYDAMPGGAGVAELGYEAADRHLPATRESIAACPCDDGCPSCIQSPKCGNGNDHLDKRAALDLLAAILDAAGDPARLPFVAHRRGAGPSTRIVVELRIVRSPRRPPISGHVACAAR